MILMGLVLLAAAAEDRPLAPGVTGALYLPETSNTPKPGIIVLHGVAKARDIHHREAMALKNLGYPALSLNYYADQPLLLSLDVGKRRKRWKQWLDTIDQAADYLASQSGVDTNQLVLAGISQGSVLALDYAHSHPRVKAVILYSTPGIEHWSIDDYHGLTDDESGAIISNAPPALIIHGQWDPVVHRRHAEKLFQQLKEAGRTVEMVTFPRAQHSLNDPKSLFSPDGTAEQVHERVRQFLNQHF